jgi:hypothetical protein
MFSRFHIKNVTWFVGRLRFENFEKFIFFAYSSLPRSDAHLHLLLFDSVFVSYRDCDTLVFS